MAACPHPRCNQTPEGLRCRVCGQLVGDAPVIAPQAPLPPLRWRASAVAGCVGIVMIALFAPLRWVLVQLEVLIHECGHAALDIGFGRPALPKFDLQYGGGITPSGERMWLLVLLLAAAWLWLLKLAWPEGPRWRILVAAGMLFLPLMALLGLERSLIAAGGHLMVFAISAVFLGRALTGRAVAHIVELWLYAAVGAALWWLEAGYHLDLIADAGARDRYLECKGGALTPDLVVLGDELGGGIRAWAGVMIAWGGACLAAMLVAVRRLGAVQVAA